MPAATALRPPPPRRVRVVKLVGGAHLFVLNADGDALCWGANSDGGSASATANRPAPTPLDGAAFGGGEFECRLVEVACGERHTAARTRAAPPTAGATAPRRLQRQPQPHAVAAAGAERRRRDRRPDCVRFSASLPSPRTAMCCGGRGAAAAAPARRVLALACGGYHSLAIAIADDDTSAPPPPRALTPAGAAATGVTPSPSLSPTKGPTPPRRKRPCRRHHSSRRRPPAPGRHRPARRRRRSPPPN